jgi:hypothetical protein
MFLIANVTQEAGAWESEGASAKPPLVSVTWLSRGAFLKFSKHQHVTSIDLQPNTQTSEILAAQQIVHCMLQRLFNTFKMSSSTKKQSHPSPCLSHFITHHKQEIVLVKRDDIRYLHATQRASSARSVAQR